MASKKLYTDITIGSDTIDPISVEVSEGYNQVTSRCSIETEDILDIDLNNEITIDMGFEGNHQVLFKGYVDEIQATRLPATYGIEGRDVLKLAIEHYIVTESLDNPWSRSNISAEDLVRDLLKEALIYNYNGAVSHYTFGVEGPAEFNLMSSWDSINKVCQILAYNCWADNGIVYFDRIFPEPAGASSKSFTVGNAGTIVTVNYNYNTDELRNKVVVFGKDGIYAEDHIVSPYLPPGFYKTAIVSNSLIDTQSMADDSASYNLQLYNRLTETMSIEAEGDPTVRCRDTVDVTEPFTEMVAEKWFVYAVSHRIDNNGYKISLNLTK